MSSTEQPDARIVPAVPPARPVRVGAGEELRIARLPGLTLTVRSRPPIREGLPPALYVHGLGGSSQNWSLMMEPLADRVDGEALDLPGFGDSPPPDDGDYSIAGHARAVIRYLDASGRGPVHLVGNSLGGTVSTRVAALRPDLVRTLTLVSPALPERRLQRTAVPTGLLAIPGVTRLFTRLTKDWDAERRTREVLALTYGDPGRVNPENFALAVEEFERRLALPYFWDALTRSARGLVDSYTLGGQHSMWRQAERVLAPTLLVYGMRDQLVSFRMARRASAAFRDSRLLTLVDAGHVAMMEYPEAVARGMRELLDDVTGREGRAGREGREDGGRRGDPRARTAPVPGPDGSGAARG
ncbi:alpha/beta hydrolase [Streptomyces sp. ME19-01-6]|uniref:alpha/beta fold hydrolase n=1 Tax=Streptomyces sp. ME19-01-6 TaxID=3028686 RepID=UPI0029AC91B1|nr:alpha/beta hydrolase [Streptomyces sp. ME19-01-6]MDX3225743.1 alpha/beta hydrolase [Streptomyces sp. ME19-01-6]